MKAYLLGRLSNLTAWLGFAILLGEITLHAGDISTLMIVLAILLIVVPEEKVRSTTTDWTTSINNWLENDKD